VTVDARARAGATREDMLFDDAFLKRLEYLEIVARKTLAGPDRGERRSRKLGAGLEFADHRRYSPGDDFKHIDWNVYARLGKLLLRQYEEEEDLYVYLMVDASASMAIGRDAAPGAAKSLKSEAGAAASTGSPGSTGSSSRLSPARTKLDQARRMAAALAYIALAGLDRASLVTFSEKLGQRLLPARGKAQIFRTLQFLRQVDPGGTTTFGDSMRAFVHETKRRGLVVVLSDFYAQDGWEEGLNLLRYHRFEPIVVQLVDERELSPNLRGDILLVDVETKQTKEITLTPRLLDKYRAAHAAFSSELETYCKARQIAYYQASVQTPFDELVVAMLRTGGFLK